MRLRVALGIPFRSTEPSRLQAFQKTLGELQKLYPWSTVVAGTDNREYGDFNRGRARNMLVDQLRSADVVVLCDADSIPQAAPLNSAVTSANLQGGMHFPFKTVLDLGPKGQPMRTYGPSAGGCYVFKPETWALLRGQDERGGWSLDDRAMLVAVNTLLGGPVYHDGVLTCLWHKRGAETQPSAYTTQLINEYLAVEGDRQAVESLLDQRS